MRTCKQCGAEFSTPLPRYRRYCPGCAEALRAEDERQRQLEVAQAAQQIRRRWVEIDSGIPRRYWSATLDNLTGRQVAGPKRLAQRYAEGLVASGYQGGASLALCSHSRGTGKTHLAAALGQLLMDYALKEEPPWERCPVLFVTAASLFRRIRATYRDEAKETEMGILEELVEVPLLILDDVGQEKASQHTVDTYYVVINGRYGADRPILLTSNLLMPTDAKGLTDLMGEAALDRLVEMLGNNWVQMEGKDYRRGGK